jgi:hypothetical protein
MDILSGAFVLVDTLGREWTCPVDMSPVAMATMSTVSTAYYDGQEWPLDSLFADAGPLAIVSFSVVTDEDVA